jgi:ATP-binding cassette subfamily B protein
MAKKEKIDFKYNLKIYYELAKNYKFLFISVILLVLFVEAGNTIDKFLFKSLVDNGTDFISDKIELDGFLKIVINLTFIFALLTLIKGFLRWLRIHTLNRLESSMIFDLKRKFFNHLIGLSHNFYTSHKTGSLISKLIRGGGAIERMTDNIIFNLLPTIFQVIIVSASLIYFDWISSLIVIITVILFIIYSIIIQNAQQKANIISNEAEDFEKANVSDIFTNIDSIKYFGKEDYIKNKFRKIAEKTKLSLLKNWDYYRWLDSVQGLIIGIGTILIIYFPLIKFINKELSLGTLVLIYTIYINLLSYLYGFVHGIRDYYRTMTDFESLFKFYKIENEIKDGNKESKIKEGGVEFKDVKFNYGKRRLFKDFNLKINANEKIALVGHSGSGKTTLIKLLYRFYEVDKGEILIDNVNIKEFKQEVLRSELSIVPQECILFDDTIYNNIAFSNPKASRKEVLDAIKFSQLDKVIKNFPKKENTIVGERGVKLSGGEKQRVSIARAILANKKILVLDEATSHLDSKTESEIQKDLYELMKGRTSIIIAHRLSTIMGADKIVVMDKGNIIQIGKHKGLINQDGIYKELWKLQKDGYIE